MNENTLIMEKEPSKKEAAIFRLLTMLFPYLFLLVASILPFIIFFLFGNNLPSGDDSYWHRIWVYDLSYGFSQGFFFSSPSHNLMGNLGYGLYLFYAPLSHYVVAIIHTVFPFISINWAWKILILLCTYLMGIWAYWLARKITKNDICSLFLATALIFAPYRINCVLYRAAYPEVIASSFFPLLFLGVYEIAHKDYRPAPFLHCVISISVLVLTHPYSAFMSVSAAFVYLILSFKGLVGIFKNKRAILYSCISIVLVFLLISFYFFPMMHYTSSGLYNISDAHTMWTYPDYLSNSTRDSWRFGGFLRPNWSEVAANYKLKNLFQESWLSWLLDYADFVFFGALGVFFVSFFSSKERPFLGTGLGVVTSLLSLVFTRRPEMGLIVPLFAVALIWIGLNKNETTETLEFKRCIKETATDTGFYWLLGAFAFTCVLLFFAPIWQKLPSIFLQGQFAWRWWNLFFVLLLMILAYFLRPLVKKKYVQGFLALLLSVSFLSCMGIVDKRFVFQSGQTGVGEPTLELVRSSRNQGSQNEYIPMVFRDNAYESEYSNSLYKHVRSQIYGGQPFEFDIENYLTPVFLEGEGEISITSLYSPEATFSITVTSDTSLIQFPQFFYDGYELRLKNQMNDYPVTADNVDGLIAFKVKQGQFEGQLKWVGVTSYRVGIPCFFVGVAGVFALCITPYFVDLAKRKKTPKEESAK